MHPDRLYASRDDKVCCFLHKVTRGKRKRQENARAVVNTARCEDEETPETEISTWEPPEEGSVVADR